METESEITAVRKVCRKQKCDPHCHYCERDASRKHEHDHAPIPSKSGGTETVTACITCHNLKDRTFLEDWPFVMIIVGIRDLVEYQADPACSQWPSRWDEMSTESRLLWAKLVRIRHEHPADWWAQTAHIFPMPA